MTIKNQWSFHELYNSNSLNLFPINLLEFYNMTILTPLERLDQDLSNMSLSPIPVSFKYTHSLTVLRYGITLHFSSKKSFSLIYLQWKLWGYGNAVFEQLTKTPKLHTHSSKYLSNAPPPQNDRINFHNKIKSNIFHFNIKYFRRLNCIQVIA